MFPAVVWSMPKCWPIAYWEKPFSIMVTILAHVVGVVYTIIEKQKSLHSVKQIVQIIKRFSWGNEHGCCDTCLWHIWLCKVYWLCSFVKPYLKFLSHDCSSFSIILKFACRTVSHNISVTISLHNVSYQLAEDLWHGWQNSFVQLQYCCNCWFKSTYVVTE